MRVCELQNIKSEDLRNQLTETVDWTLWSKGIYPSNADSDEIKVLISDANKPIVKFSSKTKVLVFGTARYAYKNYRFEVVLKDAEEYQNIENNMTEDERNHGFEI
ncbi:hypothetical protein [Fructilactobacillus fructivorans]|uniref:hypothetical protein n=1 Tax=Fructilactobacillus fructivorans TaxID=1614 RepID=UPI000705641C|nr:hypothetical protein [Fructilactobacillus fructivorans]